MWKVFQIFPVNVQTLRCMGSVFWHLNSNSLGGLLWWDWPRGLILQQEWQEQIISFKALVSQPDKPHRHDVAGTYYTVKCNWMAWCKRDVSDFFRWNIFSFKSAWIFACAFQLSSTTFPCIFFCLVCTLFLRKTKTKYSSVHNDHNKTEQEHFSHKNDAGECFST